MHLYSSRKSNCFSPGKIRLSERRTSSLVFPSVMILYNGETGEGKKVNQKL